LRIGRFPLSDREAALFPFLTFDTAQGGDNMQTQLTQNQIRDIIFAELPEFFRKDRQVREYILEITRNQYADKAKTEDRIERILDELRLDREKQDKKWEVQEKKWEENQNVINEMLAEIKKLGKKYDSTIGAMGSRWGIQTEKAFRDALRSILEDSFGVKVEQYLDYDEEGTVFGEPDQVEMDVIIHNGTLLLCEIKSSMNKSDMYVFWRKKKFYENRHARKADRVIVISPMVDRRALPTAQKLGIEVFGYADEVNL